MHLDEKKNSTVVFLLTKTFKRWLFLSSKFVIVMISW